MKDELLSIKLRLVHDGIRPSETNLKNVTGMAMGNRTLNTNKTDPIVGYQPTWESVRVNHLLVEIDPNRKFKTKGFAIVVGKSKGLIKIDTGWGIDEIPFDSPQGLANYLTIINQHAIRYPENA